MKDPRHGAAVVGAAGFIGQHLTCALESLSVPVASFTRANPLPCDDRLPALAASSRVLYYLATSINPSIAQRSPDLVASDHDRFTRLLNTLSGLDRPPLVVLTSSGGAIYDPNVTPPYAEHSPIRAVTAYGAAKSALEEALNSARVPGVILRLANVYGPFQRTGTGLGVIAHWLESAATGRPLVLLGSSRTCRDYIYVGDVVDAMVQIYDWAHMHPEGASPSVPPVNIGSGVPTSLAELLSLVEVVTARTLLVEHAVARGTDRGDMWLDIRYAAQVLGWRPRTALPEGLSRTWRELSSLGSANRPSGSAVSR